MQKGPARDHQKDSVLHSILREHSKDKDPRWRTVLLLMFWPALQLLQFQKRRLDPDTDELWQNLIWAFLATVFQFEVNGCSNGLVQKLINKTAYKFQDECRRIHKDDEREVGVDQEELKELAGAVQGIDFDDIELREKQKAEIKRLSEHLEAGTINDPDFLLLSSTRIYGESIQEYAHRTGMTYECAKKRRSRAEARIARKEKEKEKK